MPAPSRQKSAKARYTVAEWDYGQLAEGRTEGSWMDVMMTGSFNIASRRPAHRPPLAG